MSNKASINPDGHALNIALEDEGEYPVTIEVHGGPYHTIEYSLSIDGYHTARVPAYTGAELIKAAVSHDTEKLEFIKRVCKSGLKLRNHLDFDTARLEDSIKRRKWYTESVSRYRECFVETVEGDTESRAITPITDKEFGELLIVLRRGSYARWRGSDNVFVVPVNPEPWICASFVLRAEAIGKMLTFNKITPPVRAALRDEISDAHVRYYSKLTHCEYAQDQLLQHIDPTESGLPEWFITNRREFVHRQVVEGKRS